MPRTIAKPATINGFTLTINSVEFRKILDRLERSVAKGTPEVSIMKYLYWTVHNAHEMTWQSFNGTIAVKIDSECNIELGNIPEDVKFPISFGVNPKLIRLMGLIKKTETKIIVEFMNAGAAAKMKLKTESGEYDLELIVDSDGNFPSIDPRENISQTFLLSQETLKYVASWAEAYVAPEKDDKGVVLAGPRKNVAGLYMTSKEDSEIQFVASSGYIMGASSHRAIGAKKGLQQLLPANTINRLSRLYSDCEEVVVSVGQTAIAVTASDSPVQTFVRYFAALGKDNLYPDWTTVTERYRQNVIFACTIGGMEFQDAVNRLSLIIEESEDSKRTIGVRLNREANQIELKYPVLIEENQGETGFETFPITNPEVIKETEGDIEFWLGLNFVKRIANTLGKNIVRLSVTGTSTEPAFLDPEIESVLSASFCTIGRKPLLDGEAPRGRKTSNSASRLQDDEDDDDLDF